MTTTNNNLETRIAAELADLEATGNLRHIPAGIQQQDSLIDFTSNDYLGLALDLDLQRKFLAETVSTEHLLTSSASRLLAFRQRAYHNLEKRLEELYSRPALLFNSGYHANTGIISALADGRTLILADKLVHASIIDGARLSKGRFLRFGHNNYAHLRRLIESNRKDFNEIIVVVESIYSMDGDAANINELTAIKREYGNIILYVDEAHAVGCEGPAGLGLVQGAEHPEETDIIVGTFGKALASQGAFAITSSVIRDYLVNRARSLIFSTSLPPISAQWSLCTLNRAIEMETARCHLREISTRVATHLNNIVTGERFKSKSTSAIQPFVVGNPTVALQISAELDRQGLKVLPIRTPTVPAGTERLRISLSAAHTIFQIDSLLSAITKASTTLGIYKQSD